MCLSYCSVTYSYWLKLWPVRFHELFSWLLSNNKWFFVKINLQIAKRCIFSNPYWHRLLKPKKVELLSIENLLYPPIVRYFSCFHPTFVFKSKRCFPVISVSLRSNYSKDGSFDLIIFLIFCYERFVKAKLIKIYIKLMFLNWGNRINLQSLKLSLILQFLNNSISQDIQVSSIFLLQL